HHTDCRRGVHGASRAFVIEGYVAPGDRCLEGPAGVGDAAAGLAELEEHFGLFRVPEVEAIGDAEGQRAGAGDVACGFGHRGLAAFVGVERHQSGVAVDADGEAEVGVGYPEQARVAAGPEYGFPLYGGIVLLVDPPLARDVRAVEELLEGALGVERRANRRCGRAAGLRLVRLAR